MKNEIQGLYLSAFQKKAKGNDYYLVSVKPSLEKTTYAAFFSMWVGFRKDEKSIAEYEERAISLVDPDGVAGNFKQARQKVAVIDNNIELTAALSIGGHFLIEEKVMTDHWSEILIPKVVIDSYDQGCLDYNLFARPNLARFARGKLRMEILDRDGLRCRVCGKSPDDERYLTLEVHHIKPWEEGGITEPFNLITLCHLCHDGISEVNRRYLLQKIGINFPLQNHKIYGFEKSLRGIAHNSVTFKIERQSGELIT